MKYDPRPGTLDGPPAPEKKTLGQRLQFALGMVIILIPIAFLLVGAVWAIAWMVTHFPGVGV